VNVLETEWWTLALPPEWWAEAEGETILIGDRDEVGVIEISSLHKEAGEFHAADIQQMTDDLSPDGVSWSKVDLGDFRGLRCRYQEEDAALREWCVACDGLALFITYSCDTENAGMDDAAVDELLDTLMALRRSE